MDPEVGEVLVAYIRTLACTLIIAAFAFQFARFLKRRMGPAVRRFKWWLELTGTVILAAAGVSRLGWSIQTWGGESVAERINDGVFFSASASGLFALLTALFLSQAMEIANGASVSESPRQAGREPIPLSRTILYGLANWSLLVAGLANLCVGTRAALSGSVTVAATSLTAGIVLIFGATIDRFDSLRGLGIEAKTRKLDQTIDHAEKTLIHLRKSAELYCEEILSIRARMNRWDSRPSHQEEFEFANRVRKFMRGFGSTDKTIAEAFRLWIRTQCFDIASGLANSLRKELMAHLDKLPNNVQVVNQGSPGQSESSHLTALIEELDQFRQSSPRFEDSGWSDYVERFESLLDQLQSLQVETIKSILSDAKEIVPEMFLLLEGRELRDPAHWVRIQEKYSR
ncbi:MAG: hypothetical protein LC114_08980 [Bryobacterales bacterium]|nr:hypothetical protein [Bryobacterales bacterium]